MATFRGYCKHCGPVGVHNVKKQQRLWIGSCNKCNLRCKAAIIPTKREQAHLKLLVTVYAGDKVKEM